MVKTVVFRTKLLVHILSTSHFITDIDYTVPKCVMFVLLKAEQVKACENQEVGLRVGMLSHCRGSSGLVPLVMLVLKRREKCYVHLV